VCIRSSHFLFGPAAAAVRLHSAQHALSAHIIFCFSYDNVIAYINSKRKTADFYNIIILLFGGGGGGT